MNKSWWWNRMGNWAGCAFALIILSLIYFIGPLTNRISHKRCTGMRQHGGSTVTGLAFTVDFDYRGNIAHLRETPCRGFEVADLGQFPFYIQSLRQCPLIFRKTETREGGKTVIIYCNFIYFRFTVIMCPLLVYSVAYGFSLYSDLCIMLT